MTSQVLLTLAVTLSSSFAFGQQYQGCPQFYADGAPAFNSAGDLLYPSGSVAHTRYGSFYANGSLLSSKGAWFYPNGQNFVTPSSSPLDLNGQRMATPKTFRFAEALFEVEDSFQFYVTVQAQGLKIRFSSQYQVTCS